MIKGNRSQKGGLVPFHRAKNSKKRRSPKGVKCLKPPSTGATPLGALHPNIQIKKVTPYHINIDILTRASKDQQTNQ